MCTLSKLAMLPRLYAKLYATYTILRTVDRCCSISPVNLGSRHNVPASVDTDARCHETAAESRAGGVRSVPSLAHP